MTNSSKLDAIRCAPFGRVLALLAISQVSVAAVGDIDPAFGAGGVYVTPFRLSGPAFHPDGRMVSASYTNGLLHVHRDDADGHPDAGFGVGGTADIQVNFRSADWVYRSAVAPDGSTYHASLYDMVHVTSSGLLDAGFGAAGVRTLTPQDVGVPAPFLISSIAPLDDGKLAVLVSYGTSDVYACPSGWRILRLLPNGQADSSFGTGGSVPVPNLTEDCNESGTYSIEALADGYLRLIDAYGTMFDRLIDSGGTVVHLAPAVVARMTGRAYHTDPGRRRNFVVGVSSSDASKVLAGRLNADLSMDTGFGGSGDGFATLQFPVQMYDPHLTLTSGSQPLLYIQANESGSGRAMVLRLRADGSLDPTFNNGGILLLPYMDAGLIQHATSEGSLTFRSWRTTTDFNTTYAFRMQGQDLPSPGAINVDGPGFNRVGSGNTISVSRVLGTVGQASVKYRLTSSSNTAPGEALPVLAEGLLVWRNGEAGPKALQLPVRTATSDRFFQVVLYEPVGAALLQMRGYVAQSDVGAGPAPPVSNGPQATATPADNVAANGGGGAFGYAGTLLCAALLAGRWATKRRRNYSRSRNR